MTFYDFKCFATEVSQGYALKKVGAVVTAVAVLSVSGVKLDEVGEVEPVSEAIECGEFVYLEKERNNVVRLTEDAKEYVSSNSDLKRVLQDVTVNVFRFFTFTEVVVETIDSPEEMQKSIFVNIISSLSLDDALKELKNFDDTWWLAYEAPGKEKVNVDVTVL